MKDYTKIGITILRLALAFVFLWFGFSQIGNTAQWVGIVPAWATNLAPAGTLVILNGIFEIGSGIMLAFGIFTSFFAIILGIHLFVIATSFGFSAIGVRDFGLSLATIALAFMGGGEYALTAKKKEEII